MFRSLMSNTLEETNWNNNPTFITNIDTHPSPKQIAQTPRNDPIVRSALRRLLGWPNISVGGRMVWTIGLDYQSIVAPTIVAQYK